jgi:ribosomal protein L11 methyltransferase
VPSPIHVPPSWQIIAPNAAADLGAKPLRIAAGAGFGDGRHPTTQLCLQAIAALAPRERPWRMLDFGSGSGILSVAGALLGATVDAVEIDAAAIQHAERNLCENGVAERVRQTATLPLPGEPFDLIVANILRAVLLEFAPSLAGLHALGGALLLSGLVSTDVPEVLARYAHRLGGVRPEVYEREDWRGLLWRGRPCVGARSG